MMDGAMMRFITLFWKYCTLVRTTIPIINWFDQFRELNNFYYKLNLEFMCDGDGVRTS